MSRPARAETLPSFLRPKTIFAMPDPYERFNSYAEYANFRSTRLTKRPLAFSEEAQVRQNGDKNKNALQYYVERDKHFVRQSILNNGPEKKSWGLPIKRVTPLQKSDQVPYGDKDFYGIQGVEANVQAHGRKLLEEIVKRGEKIEQSQLHQSLLEYLITLAANRGNHETIFKLLGGSFKFNELTFSQERLFRQLLQPGQAQQVLEFFRGSVVFIDELESGKADLFIVLMERLGEEQAGIPFVAERIKIQTKISPTRLLGHQLAIVSFLRTSPYRSLIADILLRSKPEYLDGEISELINLADDPENHAYILSRIDLLLRQQQLETVEIRDEESTEADQTSWPRNLEQLSQTQITLLRKILDAGNTFHIQAVAELLTRFDQPIYIDRLNQRHTRFLLSVFKLLDTNENQHSVLQSAIFAISPDHPEISDVKGNYGILDKHQQNLVDFLNKTDNRFLRTRQNISVDEGKRQETWKIAKVRGKPGSRVYWK